MWDNQVLLFTTHCIRSTAFYLTCNYFFEASREACGFLFIWWVSPCCPLHALHSSLVFCQIKSSFFILPDGIVQFFLNSASHPLTHSSLFLISLNFTFLTYKIKQLDSIESRIKVKSTGFGVRQIQWLQYFPIVWSWTNYPTSFLRVFIHKTDH